MKNVIMELLRRKGLGLIPGIIYLLLYKYIITRQHSYCHGEEYNHYVERYYDGDDYSVCDYYYDAAEVYINEEDLGEIVEALDDDTLTKVCLVAIDLRSTDSKYESLLMDMDRFCDVFDLEDDYELGFPYPISINAMFKNLSDNDLDSVPFEALTIDNIQAFLLYLGGPSYLKGHKTSQRIMYAYARSIIPRDRMNPLNKPDHETILQFEAMLESLFIASNCAPGNFLKSYMKYYNYLAVRQGAIDEYVNESASEDDIESVRRRATKKFPIKFRPSRLEDILRYASGLYRKRFVRNLMSDREQFAIYNSSIGAIAKSEQYRSYMYSDDYYYMVALDSCEAIIRAGERLRNCLAQYIENFASRKSFLYLIRRQDRPDEEYYAVEVTPLSFESDAEVRGILNQAYTFDNDIEKDAECIDFFRCWLIKKHIHIDDNCNIQDEIRDIFDDDEYFNI